MQMKTLTSLMLAAPLTSGATAAFAAGTPESSMEAAALDTVKVSIGDAIAAVEAKNTGKVVEITLVSDGAIAVYDVTTLMPDGTETNYAVDATTGDVVATVDQGDGDGEMADDAGGQDDQGDGDGETADDNGQADQGDGDGELAD